MMSQRQLRRHVGHSTILTIELLIVATRLIGLTLKLFLWLFLINMKLFEYILRGIIWIVRKMYELLKDGVVAVTNYKVQGGFSYSYANSIAISLLSSVGQVPFRYQKVEYILISVEENIAGQIEIEFEENASGAAYTMEITALECIKLATFKEI